MLHLHNRERWEKLKLPTTGDSRLCKEPPTDGGASYTRGASLTYWKRQIQISNRLGVKMGLYMVLLSYISNASDSSKNELNGRIMIYNKQVCILTHLPFYLMVPNVYCNLILGALHV